MKNSLFIENDKARCSRTPFSGAAANFSCHLLMDEKEQQKCNAVKNGMYSRGHAGKKKPPLIAE